MDRHRSRMRKVLVAGLMALGLGTCVSKAQAASTDTIVLSVSPGNVAYGVKISSPYASGYNFGPVNLGVTTVSTLAIVVQNTGNISEYFGMGVSNTSPDNWAAVGVAPSTDQFRLMGYFQTNQPGSGSFGDAIPSTVSGAVGGLYNQTTVGRTMPNNTQNLWLRLEMPPYLNSGTGGGQQMTLSINGQGT